ARRDRRRPALRGPGPHRRPGAAARLRPAAVRRAARAHPGDRRPGARRRRADRRTALLGLRGRRRHRLADQRVDREPAAPRGGAARRGGALRGGHRRPGRRHRAGRGRPRARRPRIRRDHRGDPALRAAADQHPRRDARPGEQPLDRAEQRRRLPGRPGAGRPGGRRRTRDRAARRRRRGRRADRRRGRGLPRPEALPGAGRAAAPRPRPGRAGRRIPRAEEGERLMAAVTEPHLEWYPLKPRTLRVRDVGRVTPRMIRVVLTGPDLEDFRTDNFDDHVKVFLPEEGSRIPTLPRVSPEGRWNLRDPALTYRDYTVRRYDPDAEELVLDFVAHDHGPAGRWALDARPGDELGVLGPRGTVHIDHGYDYHLLGADETALPAVARRLEDLPAGSRVFAFCEVADAGEERYIDAPA